jgi:hypothetical protein
MRCRACDAELILAKVVADDTLGRGFERHTFICSACHLAVYRVVFTRCGREDDSEPTPICEAPPTVPASNHSTAPSVFSRVAAKIRGH